MKKVLMFAGQGSQVLGMGEALFPKYESLAEDASRLLGYSICDLCLGKFGDLNRTLYTQTAVYFVNHLLYLEWEKTNSKDEVAFAIGHSLGEYNALVAAGFFSFLDGLKLIQKRAELMDREKGGKMAAVLGFPLENLKPYLSKYAESIDIANINSREQIVISGLEKDLEELLSRLKEDKIKAVALNVSGAFHSRYMEGASREFVKTLTETLHDLGKPLFPVVSNKTALPYETSFDSFKKVLAEQINHGVRWVEIIDRIRSEGDFEYVEIAVKPVLSSFLKRI